MNSSAAISMRMILITGGIGCVVLAASAVAAPALTSPDAMCDFYRTRWEQGLMKVLTPESEDSDECLVRVGDANSGIGYIRGYYAGGKFCMSSSGAYFNNAGIPDAVECVAAPTGSGTQTGGNPFLDLLKDPNLKWYTLAALLIAGGSLLSGRIIRARQRGK